MGLTVDRINTIKELCRHKSENYLEVLKSYNLCKQDIDVINHIALINKIKTKDLTAIKKQIAADTK